MHASHRMHEKVKAQVPYAMRTLAERPRAVKEGTTKGAVLLR